LFFDLARSERFLWQNARLTAEGAVAAAMNTTERGVAGCEAALLGYGRIGKQLARRLGALGARVTVYARSEAALAEAESEGFSASPLVFPIALREEMVWNTLPPSAPANITVTKGAAVWDLGGSMPTALPDGEGGEVAVTALRGVPGAYAPEGAAAIYFLAMSAYLSEDGAGNEEAVSEGWVIPTLAAGRGREEWV
jgi:dipicolinate synthase subunit A